jgi:hypothetical protein
MLYLLNLELLGIPVRFQMAMLVSGWMKFYADMSHYILTLLDLKMRRHSEKC